MHKPMLRRILAGRMAILACALLLCIHAMCRPACAQESIDSFASTITIHKDGSMHVREAITVRAEGNQIKKGIYREIPLLYSGPSDYRGMVPFAVTSASIDGAPLDPVETEFRGDNIRVLMRNAEPLSLGQHLFVLEYDTSLHLRFYESNGELNWNATGVWGFPMHAISCRIILPQGVAVRKTAAWAGRAGSKDPGNSKISQPQANEAMFTLPGLEPDAQFTVAVAFDKNSIADPAQVLAEEQQREEAALEKAQQEEEQAIRERGLLFEILYDNPFLPAQCLAFCAVFLHFFLLWQRLGIDPPKGTIFPRYYPPSQAPWGKNSAPGVAAQPLSPLAVEYLRKATRISGRGLAATFLALAFKGMCRISKADEKTYALELTTGSNRQKAELSAEEQAVHRELARCVGKGNTLLLSPKNEDIRSIFDVAKTSVKQNLKDAWRLNAWVAVLGWFLVLPLAFMASFWEVDISFIAPDASALPPILLVFLVCTAFCAALVLPCVLMWQKQKSLAAIAGATALPLLGIAALALQLLFGEFEWLMPLLILVTTIAFTAIIKAPSPTARAAMDEIEGLAMYIRTAELPRMEQVSAKDEKPEDTPEVFRRLLPYALVLGLEKTWCNRFADQLQAGALEDSGVDAALVSGHAGWSDFSDNFGSAVNESSASAESSSSSSGFSSDGGGSGSGSGGGGGGGL